MGCFQEILAIKNLSIGFDRYERGRQKSRLEVIRGLEVTVKPGELVAVLGASGSGKSLLAQALLGILPGNCQAAGEIWFKGQKLDSEKIKALRGREIVLVPQSVNYLDPLEKAGPQVRRHRSDAASVARQRALFSFFGLKAGTEDLYPFELSGGMARRVLLASALMESPGLIVADEPTPGLHLEAAQKAMAHFRSFADSGGGVLLITHDLDLAVSTADRLVIFYAGATVEVARADDFQSLEKLRHPYTRALWQAMPNNGFQAAPGNQPPPGEAASGCPFGPRCHLYADVCAQVQPLRELRGGLVRCARAA